MARGKSVGNYTSPMAGKSLANYKATKNVERFHRHNIGEEDDSDSSPLSSLDDSDEVNESNDDEDGGEADEPDDIEDSDVTADSAPELIVDNLKDLSSDDDSEDNGVGNDEEDDDDDEESDSDSDLDIMPSKFLTPLSKKKSKNKAVDSVNRKSRETTPLPVPKRLDLSELRARQQREEEKLKYNKPLFPENEENEEEEEEGEDDDDDDAESIPEQLTPLQNKSRRRSSIVHYSFDERSTFPRSDSMPAPLTDVEEAIINDEEEDEHDEDDLDTSSSNNLDEEDSSGDDFDQDSLLAYLEQEESSPEVVDEYDDEDDGHIERQEERAIMNDIKNGDDLFSNPSSPYATTPVLESEPAQSLQEDEEDEDDDEEDEISFDDDFFEPRGAVSHVLISTSNGRNTSPSDDDDSYLWSYFFTSDEESGDESSMLSNILSSAGNTSGGNNSANSSRAEAYYSGDETDEDLTIPPPSLRKPGTRATEILSSSAVASRPPVLGSWDLNSERPFGIIDGLTTRTLSPPQSPYSLFKNTSISNEELDNILNGTNGARLDDIFIDAGLGVNAANGRSRKRGRSQNGFQSDSELSELALDEFIYTDELDDVDEDAVNDTTTMWSSRFNSDVPMSAFRNRGLQPVYSQPTTRRLSMSTRGRDGRRISPREAVITPVKSVKKRMKKKLRRRKSIQDDTQDNSGIGNTTDLIDELVESGALSPLFSGIS